MLPCDGALQSKIILNNDEEILHNPFSFGFPSWGWGSRINEY